MSSLLPCPFCGNAPVIQPWRAVKDNSLVAAEIICDVCFARSGEHRHGEDSERLAIAAWNTRATPAEVADLRAEVTRLREAMNKIARDRWEPRNPRASAGEQITDMITQIIQCAAAALEPTR